MNITIASGTCKTWQIAGFRSYYILIVVALTSAPKQEIDPYM